MLAKIMDNIIPLKHRLIEWVANGNFISGQITFFEYEILPISSKLERINNHFERIVNIKITAQTFADEFNKKDKIIKAVLLSWFSALDVNIPDEVLLKECSDLAFLKLQEIIDKISETDGTIFMDVINRFSKES